MDSKGHFNEISDTNEECIIGKWRKGEVAKNLAGCVCVLVFCGKKSLQVIKLDINLKRFLSKVLKVQLGFRLLIVKCKKREMT